MYAQLFNSRFQAIMQPHRRMPAMHACRYTPLLQAIARANIAHAMILGNHDAEGLLTRQAISALDARSGTSLTQVCTPIPAYATMHVLPSLVTVWSRLWCLSHTGEI